MLIGALSTAVPPLARVFDDQEQVHAAFARGELERDVVVVVREQGPRANDMPELHKLTPLLGILQRRGHRVAFVTDGWMSGTSGHGPIAMHVSPEAADDGALALVRDGDLIRVDSVRGTLEVDLPEAEPSSRTPQLSGRAARVTYGVGRELMGALRAAAEVPQAEWVPERCSARPASAAAQRCCVRSAPPSPTYVFARPAGSAPPTRATTCPSAMSPASAARGSRLCDAVEAGDWDRIEELARQAAALRP